jgi:hypothetical protein
MELPPKGLQIFGYFRKIYKDFRVNSVENLTLEAVARKIIKKVKKNQIFASKNTKNRKLTLLEKTEVPYLGTLKTGTFPYVVRMMVTLFILQFV